MSDHAVISRKLRLNTSMGNLDLQILTRQEVTATLAAPDTLPGILGAQNLNQTYLLVINASGGTFTLSFGGQATSALAYNIGVEALTTALVGLTSIGTGIGSENVAVSLNGLNGYQIELIGSLAASYLPGLSANGSSLTPLNETQIITLPAATSGTFNLIFGGQTASGITWNAAASAVQTALNALTSISPNTVAVSGSAGGPYTVVFNEGALAGAPQSLIVGDPTSLVPANGPPIVTQETVKGGPAAATVSVLQSGAANGTAYSPTVGQDATTTLPPTKMLIAEAPTACKLNGAIQPILTGTPVTPTPASSGEEKTRYLWLGLGGRNRNFALATQLNPAWEISPPG